MKSSKILVLLCVLAFAALQGCAGKMLPYEDSFECPQADKGMCTNVAGAYKVALKEDPESSYSQKAATGKTGKREMENALEAYQLTVQSGNDDAIAIQHSLGRVLSSGRCGPRLYCGHRRQNLSHCGKGHAAGHRRSRCQSRSR